MLLVRSKEGLEFFTLQADQETGFKVASVFKDTEASALKPFKVSKKGNFFVSCDSEGLSLWAAKDGSLFSRCLGIPAKGCQDFSLSPCGAFLATYQRRENEGKANLLVWALDLAQDRAHCCLLLSHKNANTWTPQWCLQDNAMFIGKLVSNELNLYKLCAESECSVNDSPHPSPTLRLIVDGMHSVAINPSGNLLAVFSKEVKARPASVRIYPLPSTAGTFNPVPLAQKLFFKHADRCTLTWSPTGKHLLALVCQDVDASGKSYYGESSLIFLSSDGSFDCRVELEAPSAASAPPIHDVRWCPDGSGYIVIYGFMPNTVSTLYDLKCRSVFSFPCGAKNTIRMHSSGRVLFGGFGNLPGHVEAWRLNLGKDATSVNKISSWQAANSTICEWLSSDLVLTATLTPRLRVDNGFKLWHTKSATLLHDHPYSELYQVEYLAGYGDQLDLDASHVMLKAALTDATKSTVPAKQGAYVPPALRKANNTSTAPLPNAIHASPEEVKVRRLQEKLADVAKLKARIATGEKLENDAVAKVAKEAEFTRQLDEAMRALSISRMKK